MITLLNIANHFEDTWCADFNKNFADVGKVLYILGPFDFVRK